MKKLVVMLCMIGVLLTIVPTKVNAVIDFKSDGNGNFCTTADITIYDAGTIKSGEFCYKYTDQEKGIKEWTINITPKSGTKFIYVGLQPSDSLTVDSVKPGSDFLLANEKKETAGTYYLLRATSENGLAAKSTVLFKVTTTDKSTEGCYLNIAAPRKPQCTQIGEYYFDNKGNAVTKDDYDKVCSGTTPNVPNTPNTGISFPAIAVGCGLVALAGVYFSSRKSKKIFKI